LNGLPGLRAGRRKFVDELITASTLSGSKLTVAITLRGDFVGKAFAYRALSDQLQGAQINLGPMTRQELTSVIRKPAEKLQLNFEAGLVERILDAVGDEPGNLPLLEFVLTELWEKRRDGLLLNENYDTMVFARRLLPETEYTIITEELKKFPAGK
jgi:DNA polymerase III delta subunit